MPLITSRPPSPDTHPWGEPMLGQLPCYVCICVYKCACILAFLAELWR